MTPPLISAIIIAALHLTHPDFQAAATAYDGYMKRPVEEALGQAASSKPDIREVKQWLGESYHFRYIMRDPVTPTPPAVTEATRAGDCKDKALWLAAKMEDPADVVFVIGRARANSRINHAWLAWASGGSVWILDPTNCPSPLRADRIRKGEYIPEFFFTRYGTFAASPD
jgi:hypothetical protein